MNDIFKKIWDNTPKISAKISAILGSEIKLLDPISDDIKYYITNKKSPLFKLTYKYNEKNNNNETNLSYILNLFTIASYKVSTNNLGDHIQIIANLNLLKKYGLEPSFYIDRDNEFKNLNKEMTNIRKVFLVMNGWHRRNDEQWPPNNKILPMFIGFHIRLHTCTYILNDYSIDYFKNNEPIGCRDIYTKELLSSKNVDTFESNCLTLTLNKISTICNEKIYVSSRNKEILKYIPSNIEYEYINHYSDTYDFDENMILAQKLIELYSQAKLVITTFLHCALPCIGMGIPVIVFYPDSSENINNSHKERMSSLTKIIDVYTFKDIDKVNWNPKPIDITDIKIKIIEDYEKMLFKCLNNLY